MEPNCRVIARAGLALVSAVVASTTLTPAGGGSKPLISTWRAAGITVDASVAEWGEARRPLEKQNVIFGVANDAENLYLTFTPGDDALQRQILMLGLTIWFDPRGAKDEHLGIRFPRGARGGRIPFRGRPPDIATEEGRRRIAAGLDSLEILRAGSGAGDPYAVDSLAGVEVRAQLAGDVLVYELKLPLARRPEYPYALGAQPGDVIGVGLQTPAMDRRRMLEGMPGGPGFPGGGPGDAGGERPSAGRGGGRSRGAGGGGPGGGEGERHRGFGPAGPGERLDVWLRVKLAEPAAGAPLIPRADPSSGG